jgi:TP901 family phage tail tape measure protein
MPFIIPSIFTAVDKFSPVVGRMGSTLTTFGQKLNVAGATSERTFRKMTNVFSRSSDQMFDYAKSALAVGATIGGIAFSAKSITEYETAVASFRTIVSDLNDADFSKFTAQIRTVALDTQKSIVDVAKSFESIAGLNEKFAATADGLAQVSTAAITLAKASRMELGPASESLVGIMNQFSYGTEQATRTINALAAGQAVGAASITQTADALTNLGSTAAGANISLEQSVALIQTMAKFGQQGAEAGSRLRSSLVKIQETGVGYKTGKFQITDALTELQQKYDALGTAQAKDAFLTKTFGLEQITTGRILLTNIPLINEFTQRVTGTSEATVAAAINSNTLTTRLEQMRDKWVTIITTTESAGTGLNMLKKAIGFVTDNMGGLVTIGTIALGIFGTWYTATKLMIAGTWALSKGIAAVNFVEGIATVINRKYAVSCFATAAGIRGMATASFFLEAGLVASLGMVGLAVTAVALLSSVFNSTYRSTSNMNDALEESKSKFHKIKDEADVATIAMDAYNDAVDRYNDKKEAKGRLKYHQEFLEKTGRENTWGDFFMQFPDVFEAGVTESLDTMGMEKPKMSDYPGIDSTTNNNTTNNSTTKVIEHKHTVELTQNGKVVGSFSTPSSLTPNLSSTTQYS